IVASRLLCLYELPVRQLQEGLAAAELATDLQLQQLVASLVVQQRRGDVAGLRAAIALLGQPLHGKARREPPGTADRKTAGEAHRIDTADLRLTVAEGEYVEIALAPQIGAVELQ